MLHASGQPCFLWGEAARHAVWLKNCTPMKDLNGITPFKALTGKKPDLRGLREWGCQVWVRNKKKVKLGGCVKEGVWVGLEPSQWVRTVVLVRKDTTILQNVLNGDMWLC